MTHNWTLFASALIQSDLLVKVLLYTHSLAFQIHTTQPQWCPEAQIKHQTAFIINTSPHVVHSSTLIYSTRKTLVNGSQKIVIDCDAPL